MRSFEAIRREFASPPDLAKSFYEAESAVADWVWTRTGSDRWHAEPLWAARRGLEPGRDYTKEPSRRHAVERYGYDREGPLRVGERFAAGQATESLVAEVNADEDVRWVYDSFGVLRTLTVAELASETGRVVRTRTISRIGREEVRVEQQLEYDDLGRLTVVRFRRSGGDYDQWVRLRTGEERIAYGADHELLGVTIRYEDPTVPLETVYTRVNETWEELAETVHAPVVDAIARALASGSEEVALVALTYSHGQASMPPIVFACPTRLRDDLLTSLDSPRAVLMPAEWRVQPIEPELQSPIKDACHRLNFLAGKDGAKTEAERTLLLEVARGLAEYPWPRDFARAQDFAVYACDTEGEELEKNVGASVPDEQIASWRNAGMLAAPPSRRPAHRPRRDHR